MAPLRRIRPFQIIRHLRASSANVAIQTRINRLGARGVPVGISPDTHHVVRS